jgi:hypothetical protein
MCLFSACKRTLALFGMLRPRRIAILEAEVRGVTPKLARCCRLLLLGPGLPDLITSFSILPPRNRTKGPAPHNVTFGFDGTGIGEQSSFHGQETAVPARRLFVALSVVQLLGCVPLLAAFGTFYKKVPAAVSVLQSRFNRPFPSMSPCSRLKSLPTGRLSDGLQREVTPEFLSKKPYLKIPTPLATNKNNGCTGATCKRLNKNNDPDGVRVRGGGWPHRH